MSDNTAWSADDLREIVRRLNPNMPAGLGNEAIPRIDRDSNAVRQLKTHVDADPFAKILLTGHIGVGKSTELLDLARNMQANRYVIQCSVADSLGAHNVDVFTLLVVVLDAVVLSWMKHLDTMPVGLVEELVEHVRKLLPEDKRPPEPKVSMSRLALQVELQKSLAAAFMGEPSREIRTGDQLSALYSDCIRRLALRYVPDVALATIDISAIVESCELVLKEIGAKAGKPVLLIIDDLDKVRDAKAQDSVFIDRAMAWLRLPCTVVATLPYDAFFSKRSAEIDDIWGDVLVLDPLPVPESEEQGIAEDALQPYLSMLRAVGAERLITARQNRRLASSSGGLPRTFVSFCNTCALHALEAGAGHVRDHHIDLTLQDKAKKEQGRLSDEDYEAIVRVLDSEGSNVREALQPLRDGILIRDGTQPPERLFRLADWAQPLVEAYRRRQSAGTR